MSDTSNAIKEKRNRAGFTQMMFAKEFEIPIDTVKGWDMGRRYPPKWAEKMILEKLDAIIEEEERKRAMQKEVYEVIINSSEIRYKDRKNIKSGCTLEQDDMSPESVAKFGTMEEAREEARKHKPSCRKYRSSIGAYFLIEECLIDIHIEDEDGEFIEGSDFDWETRFEWDEEAEGIKIEE